MSLLNIMIRKNLVFQFSLNVMAVSIAAAANINPIHAQQANAKQDIFKVIMTITGVDNTTGDILP
jgi:hypothetical protein